jgi:hypothetical protein
MTMTSTAGRQPRPQLLLLCGEQIRRRRDRRRRHFDAQAAELSLIWRPFQPEVESSLKSGLIHHRPIQEGALHHASEVRHGRMRGGQVPESPEKQAGKGARITRAPGDLPTDCFTAPESERVGFSLPIE